MPNYTKHKYVADTLTAKYAGIFEYDQNNVFKQAAISEGQTVPSGDTLKFEYYLKDHLGNVRVVFDENGKIFTGDRVLSFWVKYRQEQPGNHTGC